MSVTANLGMPVLDQAQSQKEVSINSGFAVLDVYASFVSVAIANGANVVTAVNSGYGTIILTGALTGAATVQLDAVAALRRVHVINQTTGGQVVQVKIGAGGTLQTVTASQVAEFNGPTNFNMLAGGGGGGATGLVYANEAARQAATPASAAIGLSAYVTATQQAYILAGLKADGTGIWYSLKPNQLGQFVPTDADMTSIDVTTTTNSLGISSGWTDAGFNADIQPAPLITSSAGLNFSFAIPTIAAGTYDVYIDVAASTNLSDIQLSTSGGVTSGLNIPNGMTLMPAYLPLNSFQEKGKAIYRARTGTIVQAVTGTLTLWVKVTNSRGFTIIKRFWLHKIA